MRNIELPIAGDTYQIASFALNINSKQVLQANNACLEYLYLMAIVIVPLIVVMSITNLERLSSASLLANVLLLIGFIMIWYYMFQDLQDISDVPAFGSW